MEPSNIRIFRNLESLSQAAASGFIQLADRSIKQSGEFAVALTGGGTVARFYELLSSSPNVEQVDWEKVKFFWGDERLVRPDDLESNFAQTRKLLLDHVELNPKNIYRMHGELESHKAVAKYEKTLKENAVEGLNWPRFDLVLLGMGSDGHIASIFPGEISDDERTSPVVATTANYQGRPGERISLTPLVFNSAKSIFFLVVGESKAAILAKIFVDLGDPLNLPVHRIQPKKGDVTWFVDEAAASQLPEKYFEQEKK